MTISWEVVNGLSFILFLLQTVGIDSQRHGDAKVVKIHRQVRRQAPSLLFSPSSSCSILWEQEREEGVREEKERVRERVPGLDQ